MMGGKKQEKEPHKVFYTKLYAYLRGEYTLYCPTMLWLNYLKKMSLLGRLQSNPRNAFFFITNRLEHVQLFNNYAPKLGTNTILFERAAQFSFKCGRGDMTDIMDSKMRQIGANNWMRSRDYWASPSRIFIIVANNNVDDDYFLRAMAWSERKFLTISPADTNSFYIDAFIPFFGNNDSLRGWHFYLNLFLYYGNRSSGTSRPQFVESQLNINKPKPNISPQVELFYKVSDRGLHKQGTNPTSSVRTRRRAPLSLKSFSRLKRSFNKFPRESLYYDDISTTFKRARPLQLAAPVTASLSKICH